MTTDRELLELAAKAAEIEGEWVNDYGSGDYYYQGNTKGIYYELRDGGFVVWNPLTDDGDALRLAVKLGLLSSPRVAHEIAVELFTRNADKFTATRRAIVRAAAEIGKAMP